MRPLRCLNRIKLPHTTKVGFYEGSTMSNIEQRNLTTVIELLDENSAAAMLDVSPGTLSVWRSTGRYGVPFLKVGRNVRYRRSDLLAWLDGRTRASGSTA
jgi:hypothetical protein